MDLTIGSLFSGIGGMDIGFERAGFTIRWMCEIDPFCRRVLRKHWPEVPIYEDVRSLRGSSIEHPGVLTGGFPCTDISVAGAGAGLDGDDSRLWWEMARLCREVRPRYVVLENSPMLTTRGLPAILGFFSEVGYDAEWTVISAAALGAPHLRERLFVVAYPDRQRQQQPEGVFSEEWRRARDGCPSRALRDADGTSANAYAETCSSRQTTGESSGWAAEPDVARVAHGVPLALDRRRGLGNAVVPQVAEYVARCILDHHERYL